VFEPRRSLIVPTLVGFAPVAYFAVRGATAGRAATWALPAGAALALSVVALPVCYALAALAVGALSPAADGRLSGAVLAPSDGTLVALGAVTAGLAGYLAAGDAVPPAVETVAAPLGVLLALPLAGSSLLTVAVANAAGTTPPFAVEAAAVAVGVALSVVWVAVLAETVAALVVDVVVA
jgi:hypothetical protein